MRPVTRRQADHHAARSAATRAQVMRTLERLLDSGEAFSEGSVQRILEEAGFEGRVEAFSRPRCRRWRRPRPSLGDSTTDKPSHVNPAKDWAPAITGHIEELRLACGHHDIVFPEHLERIWTAFREHGHSGRPR